jgi:hypothetical protein
MSKELGLSGDAKQWFINLISRLDKVARDFEVVYEETPLELLASFVGKCGGIWREEVVPAMDYDYYYFKCGEQYFQVQVDSDIEEEIFSDKVHNPLATRLLKELEKAWKRKRRYLKASRFKVQFGGNLLAFYYYKLSIDKIGRLTYEICRISISDVLDEEPTVCFSDECSEDFYTYKICITLNKQEELKLFRYINKEIQHPSFVDILTAIYNKRNEIEKRINPVLTTVDEVTRGAVSIFLY